MKTCKLMSERQRRVGLLLALSLAMLLASLGTSIANIALPDLAKAFQAPFHRIQAVAIAYLAGLTLFSLFAGALGDLYGRKRMLLAGLLLFSLASALCAFAPSLQVLIAARALQGIGAAFAMTLTLALMRDSADKDRLGRAMGLLGTLSAIGTALGPSLGGLLLAVGNWQWVFLVLVPAGALALILALRFVPTDQVRTGPKKLQLAILRQGDFAPHLIANLLVASVMMTTLVVGPFYLSLALKLPAATVGLVMSLGPVISVFSGVPAGRLVDGWGAGRVAKLGLFSMMSGAIALSILPAVIGLAGYLIAVSLLTPGYQLFQAANNTKVLAKGAAAQRGLISGALSLSRNLGLIAGASFMGWVFSLAVGTSQIEVARPADIAQGLQASFAVAGALIAIALRLVRAKVQVTGNNGPLASPGSSGA